MKLAVISHKLCCLSSESPTGYATDGGFPLQMAALSELFSETKLVVPSLAKEAFPGSSALTGRSVEVVPLSTPQGTGMRRKINMVSWFAANATTIWHEIRKADAVHVPIPGDVGTIGIVFALLQRKPLFVRHCGNWRVQRTLAEHLWKRGMEFFGGGRNVMVATGGDSRPPSDRNENLKWIFSSSLYQAQIEANEPKRLTSDNRIRLVIACRQEERKGTDIAISALTFLSEATLDVIGGGSLLKKFKQQAVDLNVSERVHFHGKVEQAEVLRLIRAADIFCYPTSASEGFPKVVLEALAQGLPIVTTRVSVLPKLLSSGCGILIDTPTPEAVATAVDEITVNKQKYFEMSAAALQTASQYSLERWTEEIDRTLRAAWNVDSLSQNSAVAIAGRSI